MKRRFISALLVVGMLMSIFPCMVFAENYTCDFTQLVTDGADTTYGKETDIITLDSYTTAYLTYTGTYVSADGTIYLKGTNGGNGSYKNGSYIEFTAPSAGTAQIVGKRLNVFLDGTYSTYISESSVSLTKGQVMQLGQRTGETYIKSITFVPNETTEEPTETPTEEPTETPTEEPTADTTEQPTTEPTETPTVAPYTSPSETWDFNTSTPATEGYDLPVISGNAVWTNGEIKFPSGTGDSGYVTVTMENPIKNNVSIAFDFTGHTKTLGYQFVNYSISSTEKELVSFQAAPYGTAAQGLIIDGVNIAAYDELGVSGIDTRTITTDIDFHAGKVTVTIASASSSKTFTGTLSEGTIANIKDFEFAITRTKSQVAERYISLDNLKIEEFDSTEDAAEVTITEGYTEETIAEIDCQVSHSENAPMVIYLASEQRMGTDGYSQLYEAQYIFKKLSGQATLIAPQKSDVFSASEIEALIKEAKETYNPTSVTVIGYAENASAVNVSNADKIITIAGNSAIAETTAKMWVFAGYTDESVAVADIRATVAALQKSEADVRYTEYPFEDNINTRAAEETGLVDWILNDTEDEKVVDLVLFSGQSNMAGRGDYDEATVVPAGEGYEFHAVTEPYVLSSMQEPFGKYENNANIHDKGSNGNDRRNGDMVSSIMKAYYDKTGVPIVGVQASRGGENTSFFKKDSVRSEMISRYNAAVTYLEDSGYTIRNKFLVWCQGESDIAEDRQSVYKENTLAIFNDLREATGIDKCFLVEIGHYNINYGLSEGDEPSESALLTDSQHLDIINLQRELAAENDYVYDVASFYSDWALEKMIDKYHYNQTVYNTVGTTAGENIARVYLTDKNEEPYAQAQWLEDFVVSETDKASAWKVTINPKGYTISEIGMSLNGEKSDKVFSSHITGDSDVVFGIAVNRVKSEITSITAILNDSEYTAYSAEEVENE